MKTSDFSWKGHVALLAANIIWGLNAPIGKEALAAVSATAVTAYRMLGACFAFWILSLFGHLNLVKNYILLLNGLLLLVIVSSSTK